MAHAIQPVSEAIQALEIPADEPGTVEAVHADPDVEWARGLIAEALDAYCTDEEERDRAMRIFKRLAGENA
jgi:hypothetical protein